MKLLLSRWLLLGWLGGASAAGFPEMRWDPGAEDCTKEQQRTQLHAYDETTIVIRQNPCIDYEANVLYLLIGTKRALLLDSGATGDPRLTAELTALVAGYLARPDGSRLPLVVAHTHGHQDHRAGDAAFAAQPNTLVVPVDSEGMRKFFDLKDWPAGGARFELGDRVIEIIPTPGHHPDHLVFIDWRTRLLFSGDFVLPGRVLVDDIEAYEESALRVIEAVTARCSIRARRAYRDGRERRVVSKRLHVHPDERALPLPFDTARAVALRQALQDFNGFYSRHPDYVVVDPVHNLIAFAVAWLSRSRCWCGSRAAAPSPQRARSNSAS